MVHLRFLHFSTMQNKYFSGFFDTIIKFNTYCDFKTKHEAIGAEI